MRLGNVTAGALITGMGRFRNVLRDPFIQPAGNPIGVESMKDEVHDLVPKDISGKFLLGIAENEQAALGMNAAGPFLQFAQTLKLLPILRTLENVNVRFDIGQRLVALQFLRHHAIMKLCFHGDWCRHITVSEMINVMLGLAVFPLRWINAEGSFTERVRIPLAQLREFNFW